MMIFSTKNAVSGRSFQRAFGYSRTAFAAAGLLAAVLAPSLVPASANAAEDGSEVVATVNGTLITEADLALAQTDFGESLSRYPEEQRRRILIDVLVNLQLLAQEAVKSGIAETPEFERRMAYMRSRTLRDTYFDQEIDSTITEDAIKTAYDEQVLSVERPEEVHARHILLNTEEEAKAMVEQLEGGADFAALAAENSIGPSKTNGGDLGFRAKDSLVPAFGEAAFALQPGEVSAPIQTQFGWHVITIEERRMQPAPEFDSIKAQLREYLVRTRFAEIIAGLKESATVEIAGQPEAEPQE